jgi:hypothetical protein
MGHHANRLGYYYYPDQLHFRQADLDTWLPVLKRLGAGWITLTASPDQAIPEPFIRRLMDAGIEPVVHIPAKIGGISVSDIQPLYSSYAKWGVRFVICFDRPNLKSQWDLDGWGRSSLVERFLDLCLPHLQAQLEAGLTPILPPLEPGGDYWDLAFLQAALKSLQRRGEDDVLDQLALALYAWTKGKDLDWGAGGHARWSEARPYHTPPHCQDQLGFRIFEWYAEICEETLEQIPPMIVAAGGALPGDPHWMGPDPHTEQNLAIARALQSSDVPDYVLNFAFYQLASNREHARHEAAWFPEGDEPLPVVAAIEKLLVRTPPKSQSNIRKPLSHYILIPPEADALHGQAWSKIRRLALSEPSVVGFSPKEARMAAQVTLLTDGVRQAKSLELELGEAGCVVKTIQIRTWKPTRKTEQDGLGKPDQPAGVPNER